MTKPTPGATNATIQRACFRFPAHLPHVLDFSCIRLYATSGRCHGGSYDYIQSCSAEGSHAGFYRAFGKSFLLFDGVSAPGLLEATDIEALNAPYTPCVTRPIRLPAGQSL